MAAAWMRSFGCLSPWGPGFAPIERARQADEALPLRRAPRGAGRELPLPAAGWVETLEKPERPALGKVRFGRLDRLARVALIAASQSMVQEPALPLERERAGLVLGTALGNHLTNEMFQLLLEEEGAEGASPALFAYTLPSAAVGEISIAFGLQGPSVTLVQGRGSGVAALAFAAQLVEQEQATWVLAGGADVLSPTLLAHAGEQAAGLAEGAAFCVVVGERSGALARIAGSAQGFGDEPQRVIDRALAAAGLTAAQIKRELCYCDERAGYLERQLGNSFAAGPLLGLGALLEREGASALPILVTAIDSAGTIDVLCLAEP